ncbi:hypothetical protein MUK71_09650 [Arthrobacter zhangbolii]|uniref:N-acetyltransferase domain-containing protein n=1 Tax=Arthrobacter zhangbolii TaxID=2886936 RepID=A0ABY4DMR2_9MICC|nr:hypothetical protein [Arthrobacter zhangbolii]UON90904.1 hypothetical protein MUK71_09650 [Arthrobacter zhangbolii]
MPDTVEESIQAAELAIFQRKSLSLAAAAAAGLVGRFESFLHGGLRASMATGDQYGFLNTVEGLDDQSVLALPDVLGQFPAPHQPTLIATTPSLSLTDRLLEDGYTPAPTRPIAYVCPSSNNRLDGTASDEWQIHQVSTKRDTSLFLDLLDAGYAASREVGELIRAEHAHPMVRGFIASRNDEPLAAAAMSVHPTGAVFGGASTLSAARGAGAQAALLAHRLRQTRALGIPLATATAAPGAPSIRNLARLGFTIVERTAWLIPEQ